MLEEKKQKERQQMQEAEERQKALDAQTSVEYIFSVGEGYSMINWESDILQMLLKSATA